MGHSVVSIAADAPLCSCGQRGCVEAYAGGRAIAEAAGAANCEAVFADPTKPEHAAALESAHRALAACALNMVRAYDPDIVVFCGPLAHKLLPGTAAVFKSSVWSIHDDSALVPFSKSACDEPGVQGAAAQAFRALECSKVAAAAQKKRGFHLRRATLADRPALYNVCLKTGDAGSDATPLFGDHDLLGKIFTGPYVTLSGKFAFVLVDEATEAVCGYVLGAVDTDAFNALCEQEWWPALRQQYPTVNIGRFNAEEQTLIQDNIHDRAVDSLDSSLLAQYPSHMHIDLLPHAQGTGFGTVMVSRLLDALRGAGSPGVHLGMQATNDRAFQFYTKLGFTLQHKGKTEWILAKSLQQ